MPDSSSSAWESPGTTPPATTPGAPPAEDVSLLPWLVGLGVVGGVGVLGMWALLRMIALVGPAFLPPEYRGHARRLRRAYRAGDKEEARGVLEQLVEEEVDRRRAKAKPGKAEAPREGEQLLGRSRIGGSGGVVARGGFRSRRGRR